MYFLFISRKFKQAIIINKKIL